MYTLNYTFTATPGLTILATLLDNTGTIIGPAVIRNNFEVTGTYAFTIQHSTQFRGYISFYSTSDSSNIALFCVNPQEGENLDMPISGIKLGPGQHLYTYQVLNYLGAPLEQVGVWITRDAECLDGVAGPNYSDADGYVRFMLDPGDWYLWRYHPAWNFDNPKVITVGGA